MDLDGSFQPAEDVLKMSGRYPIVHGVTSEGKPLSLFRIAQQGAHLSSRVGPREVLWVHHAIVGAHLTAESTFTEIHARMDHLTEWVGRTGISAAIQSKEWRLSYTRPEPIVGAVPDGEVALIFQATAPLAWHRAAFEEVVWLVGRPSTPLPLAELAERYLFPYRELITFATGTPAVLEEVTVRTPDVTDDATGAARMTELQVFHQFLQPAPNFRQHEAITPTEMVFALSDWTGDLGSLLSAWLLGTNRTRAALRAMFGLALAPPRWMDTTAMTWAQAIETYHRDSFSGSPATTDALKRWEEVLAACPEEHRVWLERKLRHAFEPHLHQRITEVARRSRPVIRELLQRFKGFAFHLKEARNAYAHLGSAEGASGLHLHRLCETARWVLTANVLLDLGFSEQAAKAVIQRNQSYSFLAFGPKSEPI